MAVQKMIRVWVMILIVAFTAQTLPDKAFAQSSSSDDRKVNLSGPRKQLATILFAGLGGAVLGLSTLSFYGRPQDKLSNIAIGFAIGVITGTAYVTYKAATNPQELYGVTKPRIEEELAYAQALKAKTEAPLSLSYRFEF